MRLCSRGVPHHRGAAMDKTPRRKEPGIDSSGRPAIRSESAVVAGTTHGPLAIEAQWRRTRPHAAQKTRLFIRTRHGRTLWIASRRVRCGWGEWERSGARAGERILQSLLDQTRYWLIKKSGWLKALREGGGGGIGSSRIASGRAASARLSVRLCVHVSSPPSQMAVGPFTSITGTESMYS